MPERGAHQGVWMGQLGIEAPDGVLISLKKDRVVVGDQDGSGANLLHPLLAVLVRAGPENGGGEVQEHARADVVNGLRTYTKAWGSREACHAHGLLATVTRGTACEKGTRERSRGAVAFAIAKGKIQLTPEPFAQDGQRLQRRGEKGRERDASALAGSKREMVP